MRRPIGSTGYRQHEVRSWLSIFFYWLLAALIIACGLAYLFV